MRRTAILFGGIAVLALLLTPATGAATARGAARAAAATAAAQQQPADSPALRARGLELYQNACASCHGPDPAGPSYYPRVPSVKDTGGAAAVNWAVRTGRMPWKDNKGPAIERGEPRFNDEDIRALAVYVGTRVGDAQIPDVDPARGNLQRGRKLYGQACAACHGMNGAGAALGGENIAVSLQGVTPLDVAEAIKIGPGQMPVGGGLANYEFGSAESRQEVDDIATYVESLRTDPYNRGGAPIGGKGPVPEGFVAWVIGLGALVVAARWVAGRG
ncbi:MAG TPA: c-type cytochrome [Actinomycetota bacterium]|nr:c-type cytochrome [Actinomycetota bacterium]